MRTSLFGVCGAVCAAAIAACSTGAPPPDANALSSESDATAAYYGVPKGLAVARAYFHRYSLVTPTTADPDKYLVFDLAPSARVSVELKTPATKAGPAGGVYGDLYRVTRGGGLAYVDSIDGASGDGALTFSSRRGGSYVIDVYADAYGQSVEVDLVCALRDGKCARRAQPDEPCGTCDEGLVCFPAQAKGTTCPAAGAAGRCGLLSDIACGGPSCGCDGNDYADACAAVLAGVPLKQRFPCSCDPSAWSLEAGATASSVSGAFTSSWVVGVVRKDVTVTFGPAAATYTETLTTGPDCSKKGAPCPAFPTQIFRAKGSYSVASGAITLTPDASSSSSPPTALTLETNCTGAVVLRSHEDGQTQDYDVPDGG